MKSPSGHLGAHRASFSSSLQSLTVLQSKNFIFFLGGGKYSLSVISHPCPAVSNKEHGKGESNLAGMGLFRSRCGKKHTKNELQP